jgi:hypothetical protein
VPADVVELLVQPTKNNQLSVYELAHADDENATKRVVAALQLKRAQSVSTAACLVFDSDILAPLNITMAVHSGDTPDTGVNKWHRDLTDLSARQLGELARVMARSGRFDSFVQSDLLASANAALAVGEVVIEQVSAEVRKQLKKPT